MNCEKDVLVILGGIKGESKISATFDLVQKRVLSLEKNQMFNGGKKNPRHLRIGDFVFKTWQ